MAGGETVVAQPVAEGAAETKKPGAFGLGLLVGESTRARGDFQNLAGWTGLENAPGNSAERRNAYIPDASDASVPEPVDASFRGTTQESAAPITPLCPAEAEAVRVGVDAAIAMVEAGASDGALTILSAVRALLRKATR